MKIQMNKLMLGALVVAGSMSLYSCSDEWDDHYSEVSSSVAGVSIWETLSSNSEYSAFANILKEQGYDAILSGGQTPRIYTVFAPTNEAMQSYHEQGNIDEEFIKNHIAFFYRNVSNLSDTTVTMLNDKVMRLKGSMFGDKLDPIYSVVDKNIPCQNGLIQGISGVVPYKKNIWEYIDEQGGELKTFLFGFNRTVLDTDESTEGYIDTLGQTVYLDSVTYLFNQMWSIVGQLNNEDSTYVSFLLDEEAWQEGWEKVEKNFMYREAQGQYFPEGADSLLRAKEAQIKHVLVSSLTFNKAAFDAATREGSGAELLRSASRSSVPVSVLREWKNSSLTREEAASNGTAYLTSTFAYDAPDAWQDTITVQGENVYRLFMVGGNQRVTYPRLNTDTLSLSPLSTDYDETADKKYEVSGGSYIYVQRSAAQNASATFGIANTESGLYDLWVTFIPASMVGGVTPLPSTVRATITYSYVGVSGSITSRNINVAPFEIDPRAVTRVKIAELPELGVCYAGFLGNQEYLYEDENNVRATDLINKKYGLKLQLTNAATRVNDPNVDHNLYIDCLELVPRREN